MTIVGRFLPLACLATSLSLTGCNSFRQTQEAAFIDDDGNVVNARYGELEKPYTYQIVSPLNGVALDCQDKKLVKVRLPDPNGSWINCYTCQNLFPYGTMYGTRDGKWKYLTIGLKSQIWLQNEAKDDYLLVFEGAFVDAATGAQGGR